MASVQIESACKAFGAVKRLHEISFAIDDGEFVVLVGPSGCGKSTLLRMIASLEAVSGGRCGRQRHAAEESRHRDGVSELALYPHMTVGDNVSFSLKMKKASMAEIDTKVRAAAQILNLDALLDRYPRQLSGGQRQRVAMGRALVRNPQGLPVRRAAVEPRREATREHAGRNQGAAPAPEDDHVYVTHDQVEAVLPALPTAGRALFFDKESGMRIRAQA